MGLFYCLCIAAPTILLALLYYHVRYRGAASVLNVTIRLLFSRYLKSFTVNYISVFPIVLDGFQMTTKGSRHRPEVSVSWKSLKFFIDFGRIWRNSSFNWNFYKAAAAAAAALTKEDSSKKVICVTFEDFTVLSPSLRFKDVLNPSATAMLSAVFTSQDMEGLRNAESWRTRVKRRLLAIPFMMSRYVTTACLQSLSSLFIVEFNNFFVNVDLPTHESSVKVSAERCKIYSGGEGDMNGEECNSDYARAQSTSIDGSGILMTIDMVGGKLAITQSGELAFDYSGSFYRFAIDMHVPTRHMTIGFRSLDRNKFKCSDQNQSEENESFSGGTVCRDNVDVRIQAFLDFYGRFQSAEDDATELKLAKGLGSSGRMRTMSLSIESLQVNVTDFRSPIMKTVLIDDVFFGMRTFKVDAVSGMRLGGCDWNGGIGIFFDLFDEKDLGSQNVPIRISTNVDKDLMISARRIEWVTDKPEVPLAPGTTCPIKEENHTNINDTRHSNGFSIKNTRDSSYFETAIFDDVTATKSIRVVNGGDYVDNESLKGSAKSIRTENLSADTLNWLLIAQAVSESMPTSRFSHVKHSTLMVHSEHISFSITPESLEEAHSGITDISKNTSSSSSGNGNNNGNMKPLCKASLDTDFDKLVTFRFSNLTGNKESKADQSSSKYHAHSELFEIEATLLATSMQKEYNIKVNSVDTNESAHKGMKRSVSASVAEIFTDPFYSYGDDLPDTHSGTDRVGVIYSFKPFDLNALSLGTGKIQIESIKADCFEVDFLSSTSSPVTTSSHPSPAAHTYVCVDPGPNSSMDHNNRDSELSCTTDPRSTSEWQTISRSEFLRSSLDSFWKPVDGQVSGSDIICDLCDCVVYVSAAGALKVLLTNNMVRSTIDGMTTTMNRIKGMKVMRVPDNYDKHVKSLSSESHVNKRRERERDKERERGREAEEPVSKAVLTVRCSQLLSSLLISSGNPRSPTATPVTPSPPMPCSPVPPFAHPSPASNSPQIGSVNTRDRSTKKESADTEKMTMTMEFQTFEYLSSTSENKYSWDHGSATVNDFNEKVFMSSSGFVYHTRRPAPGVPYTYTGMDSAKTAFMSNSSTDNVSALFGQNHVREGDGIGPEIPGVRYTTVSMTELEIGMSPHMRLGVAVDGVLAQYDAYKVARETMEVRRFPPSPIFPPTMSADDVPSVGKERERLREREKSFTYNPSTDTFEFEESDGEEVQVPLDPFDYGDTWIKKSEREKTLAEQSKRPPSVLVVSINMYRFSLDTIHEDKYIPCFAIMECTDLRVKIDSSKDESSVYDEISTLDFGPEDSTNFSSSPLSSGKNENNSQNKSGKRSKGNIDKKKEKKEKKTANAFKRNFLQYKHTGGIVTVSQDRMVMRFACQKEPYMDTTKWRMTGPLYLATALVFDGSIKTENEDVTLADTSCLPSLLVPTQHSDGKYYLNTGPLRDMFDSGTGTPIPESSPKSHNGRSGFCFDVNSTEASYGSALRPFEFTKRRTLTGDTSTDVRTCRRTVCTASITRSAAPVKIYWDATASAATLDMWLDDNTKDYMDSFNASLAPCLAPARELAPALPPWDSMLYWFHGFLTCSVDEMVVTNLILESPAKSVLLQTNLEEVTWHISETTFEFCARALEIGLINQKGEKKNNFNSRRHSQSESATLPKERQRSRSNSRPQMKREFSRSEGRLYETERILYVPGIVMAVSHSVYDIATAYSHHDVYLYPASEGGGGLGRCVEDDKYAYLRSRPMGTKCNFELRILDSPTRPLSLNARLDVLHGLFDALDQAKQQKANPDCSSPTDSISGPPTSPYVRFTHPSLTPLCNRQTAVKQTGPTPITAPPSGLQNKVKGCGIQLYPPLEIREKSTLTVFSIMRQWDVQVSLGRIVLCSWPSKNALSGIVLTLAGMDLQLRLLREVPLDYKSKAPFFSQNSGSPISTSSLEGTLSPAISLMTGVDVVNGGTPLSRVFKMASEESDRTRRPSLSPIDELFEMKDSQKNSKDREKIKKKERCASVTFSDSTRGGLPESEDGSEIPSSNRRNNNVRRNGGISPSKHQMDKNRAKARYPTKSSLREKQDEDDDYVEVEVEEDEQIETDFPMQVEHLFTEIHFAEIYVRDWTISRKSNSAKSTDSNFNFNLKFENADVTGNELSNSPSPSPSPSQKGSESPRLGNSEKESRSGEPKSVADLQRLFTPLCKLAHASRVVVSLTEDGEVAGKLDTFETVGLIPAAQQRSHSEMHMSQEMLAAAVSVDNDRLSSPRLHSFIGKDRRKSSTDTTDATRIKYLQTRFSASPLQRSISKISSVDVDNDENIGRFSSLSLLNPFSLSGNAVPLMTLTPTGSCSPLGGRSNSSMHTKLRRDNSEASNSTYGTYSRPPKGRNQNNVRTSIEASSFGNKIWGLRVVDMRLLMTIAIRDVFFGYVGCCFNSFQYDVVEGFKTKIMESDKDSEKEKSKDKDKNRKGQKEKEAINLFKETDITDDDIKDKESCTSEISERRTYVQEAAYSQSSSSGDEGNKYPLGEYDPFLDPYRSSQKNYATHGPVLSGTLTPFKLPPRSASAPLSERKEDKSSKLKSTRDDNAKATVTDFLPSVRTSGDDIKAFTSVGGDEKRRDRDRDRDSHRDRESCKADTVTSTANPMLSKSDKGGRDTRSSSQCTQPSQLSQSDSSDNAPEKKQKIKLTELASKGIESSQLLDLGSSPAFEKIQRREELITAQRERDIDKKKERNLGVMANSDLAELLARPVRHSISSSLSRGERDRVGRRRTGISAVTKEPKTEGGHSPKNVQKPPVSTADSNTTSANTAANRQHFGSDSNPSGANLSTSRRYFHLELVDPQLNFLDTKSHSSLIMVSGRSSLEGHRETTAVLVPAAGSGLQPKNPSKRRGTSRDKDTQMEPKRQNEIKLHMVKVSAYTVPTQNSPLPGQSPTDQRLNSDGEDTDIVHWKAMDCTVEKVGDIVRSDTVSGRIIPGGMDGGSDINGGRRWSPLRGVPEMDRGPYIPNLSAKSASYPNMQKERERDAGRKFDRVRTELLKECSYLKVAVKDFEVRASYTFWMDVTVKEANKMYVHRDKVSKDLVCSFLLDVPELCLDITSSQFYIWINVIKNVLLAPPPAMAASMKDKLAFEGEEGENELPTNKVTEIFRDSQLSNDVLNLKNKQSREEVKSLIEEHFTRATEVTHGMARVVDLFIGKGTWILRSAPATSHSPTHPQEKPSTLSPSYLYGLGIRSVSQTNVNVAPNTDINMNITHDDNHNIEKDKDRDKDKHRHKFRMKGRRDKEKDKEKEKEPTEILETGFTGVHATFTYNEDRSSAALFEVQRFWARNMNPAVIASSSNAEGDGTSGGRSETKEKGLRGIAGKISRSIPTFKKRGSEVSSSSDPSADTEGRTAHSLFEPSHDSTAPPNESNTPKAIGQLSYQDAMTALERRERERLMDKSWVLIPVLVGTEPCRRCGQLFDAEDNDSNACVFHADRDGKLGEYRRVAVKNGRHHQGNPPLSLVKMWTCCHRTEEHCKGCFSRPHICKDVMVSVRASGAPSVRIENIEMSVLRALEISIFPGAMTSWLQVRITRQLADVLHNYFSIDAASNLEVQDPFAVVVKDKAGDGPTPVSADSIPTTVPDKISTRGRMMNYLSYGRSSSEKLDTSSTEKTQKIKSKDREKDRDASKDKENKNEKGRERASTNAPNHTGGGKIILTGTVASNGRQEGVYIRYLRVGDIQVDVSLSGFPLNVENYRAVVEPFFCRGEVLPNWQRLIYSFERHASRSLIRNTASSSLTRLSNFFSFTGAPRSDGVVTTGDKIVDVIKRTTGARKAPQKDRPHPEDEEKKKIALLLGGASI